MNRLRLLHITDLHLTPKSKFEAADFKLEDEKVRHHLIGDVCSSFISRLEKKLGSESNYPNAILVTGDLVEKGGKNKGEFEIATSFLAELAGRLNVLHKRVFVVPGNHDVDWTPGNDINGRFRNFTNAMQQFTVPNIDSEGPHAEIVSLANIVEGVDVEVTLLVSPTFSGVPDPKASEVFSRLRDSLYDWAQDRLDDLDECIKNATGQVDIAAIGARQIDAIKNHRPQDTSEPIKIAMLHHHLLPDPQLEFANFEAVLDAGRVLQELVVNGYDLVLTGHKHNRRLVRYSVSEPAYDSSKQRVIDIYSGPSLFKKDSKYPLGFTLIDIFGSNSPAYAELDYREADGATPCAPREKLFREGRVLPSVVAACTQIPAKAQEQDALPMLNHLAEIAHFIHQGGRAAPFIDKAWATVKKEVDNLAKSKVTFRPPLLHVHWKKLIDLAQQSSNQPSLRLVSNDDMEYWIESLRKNVSKARKYEEPVREFKGKKERILIFNKNSLDSKIKIDESEEIVNWMNEAGIHVYAIMQNDLPCISNDFGLISDIAVSRFEGMGGPSDRRALVEDFRLSRVRKYEDRWRDLMAAAGLWNGTTSKSSFRQWAEDRIGPG